MSMFPSSGTRQKHESDTTHLTSPRDVYLLLLKYVKVGIHPCAKASWHSSSSLVELEILKSIRYVSTIKLRWRDVPLFGSLSSANEIEFQVRAFCRSRKPMTLVVGSSLAVIIFMPISPS